jgi:hypothetical protein
LRVKILRVVQPKKDKVDCLFKVESKVLAIFFSKRVGLSERKEGGHANVTKESSESSRLKVSTRAEGEERLGAV